MYIKFVYRESSCGNNVHTYITFIHVINVAAFSFSLPFFLVSFVNIFTLKCVYIADIKKRENKQQFFFCNAFLKCVCLCVCVSQCVSSMYSRLCVQCVQCTKKERKHTHIHIHVVYDFEAPMIYVLSSK